MSVVTIKDLSKSYFSEPVLRQVNLTIEEGERLALIGENGSGKTTLMRLIAGLEVPDTGTCQMASGVVFSYLSQQMEEFTDLSVPVLSAGTLDTISARIAEVTKLLAEAPDSEQADLLQEYQELTERFERAGGYTYLPRLAQALARLGISGELLERPISSLSGGERMRVLLARRLLENHDFLMLDEPTNHLDLDGLEWLEEYLLSYKGTLLFISHDRYFIDKIATKTAELSAGKLVLYKGGYTAYSEQKERQTEFTKLTLERLKEEKDRQAEVTQTMLSHRKMASYHAREKVVAKLEDQINEVRQKLPQNERRMNFRFIPRQDKRDVNRVLLSIEDASLSWDGEKPLFSEVNLELKATQKLVLAGPNGCGKSTLLAMIMGKIQNFSGELSLAADVRFGHLGQYAEFSDESKTLLQELQERTDLLEGDARNLLARYGFRENDVYKTIEVLSGGERSRLYLCCLLEEEPDILFLDEPTNHLDIHSREVLEDAITNFNGAVLAVSHDRYFIEKCDFTVYGIIGGHVRAYQSYASYRHFARLAAQQAEPEVQVRNQEAKAAPSDDGKLNLVKLRRERQKLERRSQELEARIELTEVALAAKEEELQGTDPGAYQEYADLEASLEKQYDDFFALGQEIEKMTTLLAEE